VGGRAGRVRAARRGGQSDRRTQCSDSEDARDKAQGLRHRDLYQWKKGVPRAAGYPLLGAGCRRAEIWKLFGNSAYAKAVTNTDNHNSTTYTTKAKSSNKYNSPQFKDSELLNSSKYEATSPKKEIREGLPIQIGAAVYQLAKLRMLRYYYDLLMNILIELILNYARWTQIQIILPLQLIVWMN
jgi:hypothetical protein